TRPPEGVYPSRYMQATTMPLLNSVILASVYLRKIFLLSSSASTVQTKPAHVRQAPALVCRLHAGLQKRMAGRFELKPLSEKVPYFKSGSTSSRKPTHVSSHGQEIEYAYDSRDSSEQNRKIQTGVPCLHLPGKLGPDQQDCDIETSEKRMNTCLESAREYGGRIYPVN